MLYRYSILVLTTLLLYTADVQAQAEAIEQPARWYGWQTLIADGISMPTAVISYHHIGDAGEVLALSVTSSIITPAIIHAAHGNWGALGISLGIRIPGALLLGLGVLSGFESHDRAAAPISPFYVAGGFMMLTASLVDSLLAFEELPVAPKPRAWTLQPWASTRERAGGLSFAGHF